MSSNIASIVVDAWEQALRESPDPFETNVFGPRRSYREWLDRPLHNVDRELIPRIVTVRRNMLRRLRQAPRLPA